MLNNQKNFDKFLLNSKTVLNIIILCCGKGTRLWPISREKKPKQFYSLVNENSMFQNTILRFLNSNIININKFIIICNKDHEFIVNE